MANTTNNQAHNPILDESKGFFESIGIILNSVVSFFVKLCTEAEATIDVYSEIRSGTQKYCSQFNQEAELNLKSSLAQLNLKNKAKETALEQQLKDMAENSSQSSSESTSSEST